MKYYGWKASPKVLLHDCRNDNIWLLIYWLPRLSFEKINGTNSTRRDTSLFKHEPWTYPPIQTDPTLRMSIFQYTAQTGTVDDGNKTFL